MSAITRNRVESIDILRGIVMLLMALDHVRDYLHIDANVHDPLNLVTTTPVLYFTRWVTHFCAPIFVFLSGTSIFLQSQRKTKKVLSEFLLKRGLWLIAAELVIITFGWSFNPAFNLHFLQVIWAIGISMIILAGMVYLPFKVTLATGIAIVAGHNLLDFAELPVFSGGFWWELVHHGNFVSFPYAPNHAIVIIYPFLPWTGLMILGYCAGTFFTSHVSSMQRKRVLHRLGLSILLLFVVLRYLNFYGDPFKWTVQRNWFYTFLSFINVHKYPPSLLYMCITIGPALLLLPVLERVTNRFTAILSLYGRVAFFYYILHIYLIHTIATIAFFVRGHALHEGTDLSVFPFYFVIPGEGFSLGIVYLIWLAVIISLYPLCKWYDRYKYGHKEKWWLSYL